MNTKRNHIHRIIAILVVMIMILIAGSVSLSQDAEDNLPPAVGIRPDAPAYALHGQYWVGTTGYESETEFHPTKVMLWYPALNPEGLPEEHTYNHDYYPDTLLPIFGHALADAQPNVDNGPYPMVILATGHEGPRMFMAYLGEHLASLGFVVVSADFEDNQGTAGQIPFYRPLYTRPADIRWLLDEAENLTAEDGLLAGMIDTENSAVVGYSYGGYTALASAGARLDMNVFAARIAENPELCDTIVNCNNIIDYQAELAELAGLDAVPEGQWPSWGDDRVDAIVTIASGMGNYFDAESLADVDVPVMMFAGTADPITAISSQPIYENLSTPNKRLALFDNATHMAWFWTCDEAPWLSPDGFFFCGEPVWDKERTHDLAKHFIGAFMLEQFYGDAGATEALLPENVQFPGITYQAQVATVEADIPELVTSNSDWTPVVETIDGVEMVQVPAGCFMMGDDEGGWAEKPAHEICLDGFWLDRYEVSVAQFEQFGAVGAEIMIADENQPRTMVNWQEAAAFCESRGGRLPTEAEWEYAARGPESWTYVWGNDFVADYVPDGNDPMWANIPVGTNEADVSWVGAHDLNWSAYEWTNDFYGFMYYGEFEGTTWNPTGPDSNDDDQHSVRGFFVIDDVLEKDPSLVQKRSQLISRLGIGDIWRWNDLGFRCARDS